jgi:hypothetical protein
MQRKINFKILRLRRVWRYQKGNQNPYIEEEQTKQWTKEKVQKDKQRSTKHTHKTKEQVTRTPLRIDVVVFYFCFLFCFCIALFVLLWVRACGAYQDFLDRGLLPKRMLLNQGFLLVTSSLRKFTIDAMLWLTAMEYLCHKWPRICSNCRNHLLVLSSFKTYHRVCN